MVPNYLHFHQKIKKTLNLNFLLFTPPGVEATPDNELPLVFFLHGSGERGDQLDKVTTQAIPQILEHQKKYPFVLLAPQCPQDSHWNLELDALEELLIEFSDTYAVDKNRISLAGVSMGAGAGYLWAQRSPNTFSAMVMCCGRAPWWAGFPEKAAEFGKIPSRIFHGRQDDLVAVKYSEQIHAVRSAAGQPSELTIYDDLGHDCWTRAFAEESIYPWLITRRKP